MVDRMVSAVQDHVAHAVAPLRARLDALERAGLVQEAIVATKALQRALETSGLAAQRRRIDRHEEHLQRLETKLARHFAQLAALEQCLAALERSHAGGDG
jgi:hypothetical protein